ncbi:hypothetical protein AALB39_26160 [Lachnospiraceae bacterium 54-53]
MYCVIQEIKTRRMQKNGYPKRIESYYTKSNVMPNYYGYYYSTERFERPIKKAYRISIHESYREDGIVKKNQYGICTVNYYDLADDIFTLYDWGDSKISIAADSLGCSPEFLYNLIQKKLAPLQERIQAEFAQTEEFKVHEEHERITTLYAARKAEFNTRYGIVGSNEYDQCYDVFGTLQNPQRLNEIEAEYIAKKKREKQAKQTYRRYYDDFFSNYGKNQKESCPVSGHHEDGDKIILKQFYRTLSKTYHPDSNPGKDTSEEMKLLNQIKAEWGL